MFCGPFLLHNIECVLGEIFPHEVRTTARMLRDKYTLKLLESYPDQHILVDELHTAYFQQHQLEILYGRKKFSDAMSELQPTNTDPRAPNPLCSLKKTVDMSGDSDSHQDQDRGQSSSRKKRDEFAEGVSGKRPRANPFINSPAEGGPSKKTKVKIS